MLGLDEEAAADDGDANGLRHDGRLDVLSTTLWMGCFLDCGCIGVRENLFDLGVIGHPDPRCVGEVKEVGDT